MYERSYGDKYQSGYRSAAEIAKLMRADIKAAIAEGTLPGTMKNYSVRVENYSGGRSINIKALCLEGMWQQCDGTKPGSKVPFGNGDGWTATSCGNPWCKAGGEYRDHPSAQYHQVLTVEGQRVRAVLQGIHRAYNHDGSDVMTDYFDVNYYGDANIEDEREAAWREREKVRKDRMAQARKEVRANA